MPSPILAFLLLISSIIAISALPVPFVRIDISTSPPVDPFSTPPANFFDVRQQQIIEDVHADPDPNGRDVRLHITMSVDEKRKESDRGLEEENGMETLGIRVQKTLRLQVLSQIQGARRRNYWGCITGRINSPLDGFSAGFSPRSNGLAGIIHK